jgi:hypothetical protein
MRGPLLAIVAVIALGGAGWLVLRTDELPPAQSGGNAPGGTGPVGTGPVGTGPASPGAGPAAAPHGGPAVPAVHAPAAELRTPLDLADRPTAWLQVVAAADGAPVPGAAIYRLDTRADTAAITFTDAAGLAGLPLKKPEQLIVAMRGYLLRQAATHLGSSAERPQQVQLEADRYSLRVVLRFTLPGDRQPDEVCVRLRPLWEQKGAELPAPGALRGASEAVVRAWREQHTIAMLRPVPEVHVQLGPFNQDRVFVLAAEDQISFAAPGLYTVDAATRDGFVGRATLDAAGATAAPFVVALQPGRAIGGTVRSAATGAPVARAEVVVLGGDPLDLAAVTDEAGRFSIGPLADGSFPLEVRHRDYELGRAGPVAAGTDGVAVRLDALPATALRGRVRARPSLQPIAGATASVTDALGKPITATSDQDGWFVLRGSGKGSVRLVIGAPHFMPYSELLDPGAPAYDYDLWPDDTATRLREKMTAVLSGTAVDEAGQALPSASVRLAPERALAAPAIAGRRVLLGGALPLPLITTAGLDGSFQLETQCEGPGALTVVDAAGNGAPLRVEVVLGSTIGGLQVVGRRRQ